MDAKKPVEVMGYLAGNWTSLNNKTPALILNPDASPLDLLAWCWGEIASMNASLDSLASAEAHIEPAELSGIFLHRMAPLQSVMHEAVSFLIAEKALKKGVLDHGKKLKHD